MPLTNEKPHYGGWVIGFEATDYRPESELIEALMQRDWVLQQLLFP